MFGIDELPALTSGLIELFFEPLSTDEEPVLVGPVPAGSSVYKLIICSGILSQDQDPMPGVNAFSYYAESLLDTPTKLDKTYYTMHDGD